MNILLLSHSPNDPNAGASRVYHFLHEGLSARGHRVKTLHGEDFRRPRNSMGRLIVDRLLLPQFISWRMKDVEPKEFDVIMSPSGMAYPLFARMRQHPKRPLLVSHMHGLMIYDHIADVTEQMLGRYPMSLKSRLVTGPMGARWDMLGAKQADIVVVQNSRDLDFLAQRAGALGRPELIAPALHPTIQEAGKTVVPAEQREPATFLWFGSWTPRKGIYAIARAFDMVLDTVPGATLTLGGTGMSEEFIKAQFSSRAAAKVRVLPRITIAEQIAEMNRNAIFLFPSLSEGFGLALVEAMASGLAPITTHTGLGGSLVHREDAVIVPYGNGYALAAAMIDLACDTDLRCKIARRGQVVAQGYSVGKMIASYEQLFHRERGKLA